MFAIAFALGLNTAQTKALFNKVLLAEHLNSETQMK